MIRAIGLLVIVGVMWSLSGCATFDNLVYDIKKDRREHLAKRN